MPHIVAFDIYLFDSILTQLILLLCLRHTVLHASDFVFKVFTLKQARKIQKDYYATGNREQISTLPYIVVNIAVKLIFSAGSQIDKAHIFHRAQDNRNSQYDKRYDYCPVILPSVVQKFI